MPNVFHTLTSQPTFRLSKHT